MIELFIEGGVTYEKYEICSPEENASILGLPPKC